MLAWCHPGRQRAVSFLPSLLEGRSTCSCFREGEKSFHNKSHVHQWGPSKE